MIKLPQVTIYNSTSVKGKGLFTGEESTVEFHPAPINFGIVIEKINNNKIVDSFKLNYDKIKSTPYHCSAVGNDNFTIYTVEHLLAALYCLEISNIIIKVHGNEIPILDGSAEKFLLALKTCGIHKQNEHSRETVYVSRNINITSPHGYIKCYPSKHLVVNMTIENEKIFKTGSKTINFDETEDSFYVMFSRAKTFSTQDKLEYMKQNGIFPKGGTTQNAIIYNNGEIINLESASYPNDEALRHKILDFCGDMLLSGVHIKGRFECLNSGHSMNHDFLKEVFSKKENYQVV